jgi:hypothetical protein
MDKVKSAKNQPCRDGRLPGILTTCKKIRRRKSSSQCAVFSLACDLPSNPACGFKTA